jgi:leucine dehydrogenase
MDISEIQVDGYERVARCRDPRSGLHALIAIHDTTLGPALGGMRMLPYASEDEALFDVLRLARGMTYKSAVADTGLGGGKSVVIGDPKTKSRALFEAMGRFVDSMGGRYITAEDMNIGVADLEIVRTQTRWVSGLSRESGGSGNPSPYTAWGCLQGIRAVLEDVWGSDRIEGKRFLLQGVGAVGGRLAVLL